MSSGAGSELGCMWCRLQGRAPLIVWIFRLRQPMGMEHIHVQMSHPQNLRPCRYCIGHLKVMLSFWLFCRPCFWPLLYFHLLHICCSAISVLNFIGSALFLKLYVIFVSFLSLTSYSLSTSPTFTDSLLHPSQHAILLERYCADFWSNKVRKHCGGVMVTVVDQFWFLFQWSYFPNGMKTVYIP